MPPIRIRPWDDVRAEWSDVWARAHDRAAITVDWRDPNLHASRFWPRRGFRPQFLRLYRAVA